MVSPRYQNCLHFGSSPLSHRGFGCRELWDKFLLCPEWLPVHCHAQCIINAAITACLIMPGGFSGVVLCSAESSLAWSLSGLPSCAQSLHSLGVTGQLWDTAGIVDNTPKASSEHPHYLPTCHHLYHSDSEPCHHMSTITT